MSPILESSDDIEVPEAVAPSMFEREFAEYMGLDDTGLKREQLPRPDKWHVLVLPKQPKKMSKGGIALPDQAQSAEAHLNYIGQILALGPLAGKNDKFLNPAWTHPKVASMAVTDWDAFERENGPRYLWDHKVGDWVIFGKFAGQIIWCQGVRLLNLNDDHIIDGIDSPTGYKVYVD